MLLELALICFVGVPVTVCRMTMFILRVLALARHCRLLIGFCYSEHAAGLLLYVFPYMPRLSLGCVLGNKLRVGESMNHLLLNTAAADSTSDNVTLSQDY